MPSRPRVNRAKRSSTGHGAERLVSVESTCGVRAASPGTMRSMNPLNAKGSPPVVLTSHVPGSVSKKSRKRATSSADG